MGKWSGKCQRSDQGGGRWQGGVDEPRAHRGRSVDGARPSDLVVAPQIAVQVPVGRGKVGHRAVHDQVAVDVRRMPDPAILIDSVQEHVILEYRRTRKAPGGKAVPEEGRSVDRDPVGTRYLECTGLVEIPRDQMGPGPGILPVEVQRPRIVSRRQIASDHHGGQCRRGRVAPQQRSGNTGSCEC